MSTEPLTATDGAAPVRAPRSLDGLARNARQNLERWSLAVAPPPPARMLRPSLPAMAAAAATIYVVIGSMFALDAAASDWASREPSWFRDAFERITNFGLSGWFLIPSAAIVLGLAAVVSPALSRRAQGVLTMLAARFGFVFRACSSPSSSV